MKTSLLSKQAKALLGTMVIACTLLNTSAPALPGILDTAVNPANNHVYYLLDNSNWTDAQTVALGLGGNLATVNNLAENNWIWNLWAANRSLWIGFNDVASEGSFVWASGEVSGFTNWRPGEPNNGNNVPGQSPENWTYIYASNVLPGGVWNDFRNLPNPGEPLLHGVVEVVPEPSAGLLLTSGMLTVLGAKRIRKRS